MASYVDAWDESDEPVDEIRSVAGRWPEGVCDNWFPIPIEYREQLGLEAKDVEELISNGHERASGCDGGRGNESPAGEPGFVEATTVQSGRHAKG